MMSRILFIRHAEPERSGDDFGRPLNKEGRKNAEEFRKNNLDKFTFYDLVAFSYLKRAEDTAKIIFKDTIKKFKYEFRDSILNEWNPSFENKEIFIERVGEAIKKIRKFNLDTVVVSHARFMTVAHQILKPKEIVLGFDFLESFEAEL